jgi:hypothetical protein
VAVQAAIPLIGSHPTCNYEQALRIIAILDLPEFPVMSTEECLLEVFLVKGSLSLIVSKRIASVINDRIHLVEIGC